MRSPEVILKNLGDKAKDKSYQFKRLYRNLYTPEMYLLAYQKIASSEGSMTAGTDGNTLDGMSMEGQSNHCIAERPQLPAAASQTEIYGKEKQQQKKTIGYSIH